MGSVRKSRKATTSVEMGQVAGQFMNVVLGEGILLRVISVGKRLEFGDYTTDTDTGLL